MNMTKIPNGDEKVTVELTVKELIALTGIRFPNNHKLEIEAKKKLKSVLEDTFETGGKDNAPIPYQMLN
jgi:hypothetical protein